MKPGDKVTLEGIDFEVVNPKDIDSSVVYIPFIPLQVTEGFNLPARSGQKLKGLGTMSFLFKLGTKVALKKKDPKLYHRCKGFVTRYNPIERPYHSVANSLRFWCLKCEKEIPWVGTHQVVRVVPKAIRWANFLKTGKIARFWTTKKSAAMLVDVKYKNEIAPIYLGRRREVKRRKLK